MFKKHRLVQPESTQVVSTPSLNPYAIQTDGATYVFFCFLHNVYDKEINEDIRYLSDFYMNQGCYCTSFWYNDVDVRNYVNHQGILYCKEYNDLVLFNPKQEKVAVGKSCEIHYAARFENPILVCSKVGAEQRYYQIAGSKAQRVESERPGVTFDFGRYFGYAKTDKGVEFLFAAGEII